MRQFVTCSLWSLHLCFLGCSEQSLLVSFLYHDVRHAAKQSKGFHFWLEAGFLWSSLFLWVGITFKIVKHVKRKKITNMKPIQGSGIAWNCSPCSKCRMLSGIFGVLWNLAVIPVEGAICTWHCLEHNAGISSCLFLQKLCAAMRIAWASRLYPNFLPNLFPYTAGLLARGHERA